MTFIDVTLLKLFGAAFVHISVDVHIPVHLYFLIGDVMYNAEYKGMIMLCVYIILFQIKNQDGHTVCADHLHDTSVLISAVSSEWRSSIHKPTPLLCQKGKGKKGPNYKGIVVNSA